MDNFLLKLKSGRKQTFLKLYVAKFPFVQECTSKGADNIYYAHCTICKTDIHIASAGSGDIKRHEKTTKHAQNAKHLKDGQPRLNVFMQNRMRAMEDEGALERKEMEEAKLKKLKEDTIRAEVMMVELIAKLNISMNAATTLAEHFKVMFPDSAIAQEFQCGRTKATAIVKDLAMKHKSLLLDRMKNGPFSLSTDGSNDSNSKLYPIVVRTVNPDTLDVDAEVVSLPVLEDSGTGENIFKLLDNLLKSCGIDWTNCVAFGCDNASVMTGVHKGVMSFIKRKNPNCVLSGCTLHLVHIAAEKAAHQLPYQPADLLVDIYYYMKKSSVRQRNLYKWQAYHNQDQRKVLKHVSTRWLSISRCIDRLTQDWRPLKSFFKEEVEKHTKPGTSGHTKAKEILTVLNSQTAKVCTLFLKNAVKMFDPFLIKNQTEAPQIHNLQESMAKLMQQVISRYVKPSACTFKAAFDIDFETAYNIKNADEITIGSETEKYMKDKKFSKQKSATFINSVILYYQAVCRYMKTNLPHDNKFLIKVTAAQPDKLVENGSVRNLKAIMNAQPAFIPSGTSIDEVECQLGRLQQIILEKGLPEADRLDKRWALQARADDDTKFACMFLLNLLVVPHSSASCERVFSYVRKIKTDQRSLMGDKLLEALIICKHVPGLPSVRNYSPDILTWFKGSCMRHNKSNEVL